MAEAVDWGLAEQVAAKLSGSDAFADSYHAPRLTKELLELTPLAERLVSEQTGLIAEGVATARVVSRQDWVRANISSFKRLLKPVTTRMEHQMFGPSAIVGRRLAGIEVGTLLGLMSRRVLGQYDLLVTDDGSPGSPSDDGDVVYFVGPNMLALEKRFAFPPTEFRLWVALHEVTHRAQFTGVTWMRPYFLGLMDEVLAAAEPDPKRLLIALRRTVAAVRAGKNPLAEGGLVSLLASDEQQLALDRVGGLMSLLEGHGDVTMDRAGVGHVPSAGRFAAVLRSRRESTGVAKFVRQVTGLEAKMRQYQDGEDFIAAVERERGARFVDQAWLSQHHLPTLSEIRRPQDWIRRVEEGSLSASVSGSVASAGSPSGRA
jgi:coenzyme F420 biosynthesis associated uncharacterized protein